MPFRFSPIAIFLICAASVLADWRTDGGYTQLQAELGESLPTGSGIVVLHCEAATSTPTPPQTVGAYLPQSGVTSSPFSGTSPFTGQTFYAESGLSDNSGHAFTVGVLFYSGGGVSPGVGEIHCYEANDFLNRLLDSTPPPTVIGQVQNHSYIGSTDDTATDTELIRRYDAMVDAQGTVLCVPLNNGSNTTVPALPSCSYHAICAGLRNGNHSRGGTTVDTLPGG